MQLPPLFYNLIKLFFFFESGLLVGVRDGVSEAALDIPFNCGWLYCYFGVVVAIIWPAWRPLSVRRSVLVTIVISFLYLDEKVGFI